MKLITKRTSEAAAVGSSSGRDRRLARGCVLPAPTRCYRNASGVYAVEDSNGSGGGGTRCMDDVISQRLVDVML